MLYICLSVGTFRVEIKGVSIGSRERMQWMGLGNESRERCPALLSSLRMGMYSHQKQEGIKMLS